MVLTHAFYGSNGSWGRRLKPLRCWSRFLKLTTKILALKKLAGDLAAHRHLIDIITVVQDGQDRFDSVSYSSPMLEVFCRYESLLVRAPYSGVG